MSSGKTVKIFKELGSDLPWQAPVPLGFGQPRRVVNISKPTRLDCFDSQLSKDRKLKPRLRIIPARLSERDVQLLGLPRPTDSIANDRPPMRNLGLGVRPEGFAFLDTRKGPGPAPEFRVPVIWLAR